MSSIFSMDNPLFVTLGKVYDLVFLSVVWIILCLPIITIGPATTALYYAVVKVVRKERGYLFREFFKCFRLNFKKASIIGTIMAIIFAILAYDMITAYKLMTVDYTKAYLFMGIYIAISIIVVSFSIYVYPILSRFEMSMKQLIKATIFMSIRHLLFTVLMIVIFVAAVLTVGFVLPTIFIVPALYTLIMSLFMEKIFKKYMPESSGPGEETGKDEWYLD